MDTPLTPSPAPMTSWKKWLLLGVIIIAGVIAADRIPTWLGNLKSSLLTAPVVTVSHGQVSDVTPEGFAVTFDQQPGEVMITALVDGKELNFPVTVESALSPQAVAMGSGGGGGGLINPPSPAASLPATSNQQLAHQSFKGAAELKNPFVDVTEQTKYFNAIMKIQELGLMKGSSGEQGMIFEPARKMDRAQFATIMMRLKDFYPFTADKNITPEACRFSDVDNAAWYSAAVTEACQNGLVKGYPDHTFRPTALVNYAEVIAVVIRTAAIFDSLVADELHRQIALREHGKGAWYDAYIDVGLDLHILSSEADQDMSARQPWLPTPRAWVADIIVHLVEANK